MSFEDTPVTLLRFYGRPLTLRYITDTGFSFSNPSGAPTESTNDISVTGYTSRVRSDRKFGTLVKENDLRCYLSNKDSNNNTITSPTENDKIVDGTIIYSIILVREYYEAQDIVMYELVLRS